MDKTYHPQSTMPFGWVYFLICFCGHSVDIAHSSTGTGLDGRGVGELLLFLYFFNKTLFLGRRTLLTRLHSGTGTALDSTVLCQ